MPDWMSFPPLNALTAQETGDWCGDQPLPQGYMMFLTKSDARKNLSEVVAEDGFKPVFQNEEQTGSRETLASITSYTVR